MKPFAEKLHVVRVVFAVCLLVFGCLLAVPGIVQVAFGIVNIADDFKCKRLDCKNSVSLTWDRGSGTFTDGCTAPGCTGKCNRCSKSNTDHPYCFASKGDQCEADAQSFRFDDCGVQIQAACAKGGGAGPSKCCPTVGGAATTNDCKAPRCANP